MNIKDIKLNDTNPRKISEESFEKLRNSIKEDPQMLEARPLIIDENNIVLGGNMRLRALKDLGYTEVPTTQVKGWTDEQKRRFIVKDNLSGGEWDYDLLTAQYDAEELSAWGMEGLDKYFIDEPSEKDDEVPETPDEPKSKLGDLYELGEHRVLCGDSCEVEPISSLMGEVKADMVFTDPPYNIAYEGGSKKREMIKNDEVVDFYDFLLKAYSSFALSMKLGASIYVCHADSERVNFTKAFKDAGFYLSSVIIWAKNNATFGRQDYFWKHEPILYGWREGAGHTWHGDNKQDTIWNVDRPSRSDSHPTMKPIELIQKAILNSSKQDDIVLDLFLGSGSTLIASQKTGRICYGMELDPKYVDVIVQRYVDFTGNENIILNGKQITWNKSK